MHESHTQSTSLVSASVCLSACLRSWARAGACAQMHRSLRSLSQLASSFLPSPGTFYYSLFDWAALCFLSKLHHLRQSSAVKCFFHTGCVSPHRNFSLTSVWPEASVSIGSFRTGPAVAERISESAPRPGICRKCDLMISGCKHEWLNDQAPEDKPCLLQIRFHIHTNLYDTFCIAAFIVTL